MDSLLNLLNLNFMYSFRTGNLLVDLLITSLFPLLYAFISYVIRDWWPNTVTVFMEWLYRSPRTEVTMIVGPNECTGLLSYSEPILSAVANHAQKTKQQLVSCCDVILQFASGKSVKDADSLADALQNCTKMVHLPYKGAAVQIDEAFSYNVGEEEIQDEDGKESTSRGGASKTAKKQSTMVIMPTKDKNSLFGRLWWLLGRRADGSHRPSHVPGSPRAAAATDGRGVTPTFSELGAIKSVLETSLQAYIDELKASDERGQVLYQPLMSQKQRGVIGASPFADFLSDKDDDKSSGLRCLQYELHLNKTFQTIFFPQKERLLKLLSDFESKKGKFAVPGFPHRLVFLLHGPPGTGKTSLAKAISLHLRRDLFAVSLAHVRSDKLLNTIMFGTLLNVTNAKKKEDDDEYSYYGRDSNKDSAQRISPEKIVYILEDVDASTDIVLHQQQQLKEEAEKKAAAEAAAPESDATAEKASEKEEADDKASSSDSSSDDNSESEDLEEVDAQKKDPSEKDLLTVEGIRKALQGMLDFPGRIVILTTNHVERLHPMLLQPGIITMKIHMSNLTLECAMEMIRHYFSHVTISDAEEAELREVLRAHHSKAGEIAEEWNSTLSPAELEQRCAEHNTVHELIEALRLGSHVDVF